ncbi:FkbM family methyltransferase [Salinibacter ruber]|uniref:FkbM family methyltransferase n=1 Tax=Salinibacter ruber TaxID=146919 RepID=UPI002169C6F8
MRILKRIAAPILFRTYDKWSRYFGGYKKYNLEHGKMYLDVSESTMMMCRALEIHERKKEEKLKEYLEKGYTFLDVGANKGYFSIIAADIVGEEGRVLSFEPDPDNFIRLKKNIEENELDNVECLNVAVGAKEGEEKMVRGKNSGWSSLVRGEKDAKESFSVEKIKLDKILEKEGVETVSVVKIDVEGAECRVIKGAKRTIDKNDGIKLLIEVHESMPEGAGNLLSVLRGVGLTVTDEDGRYIDEEELKEAGPTHSIIAHRT